MSQVLNVMLFHWVSVSRRFEGTYIWRLLGSPNFWKRKHYISSKRRETLTQRHSIRLQNPQQNRWGNLKSRAAWTLLLQAIDEKLGSSEVTRNDSRKPRIILRKLAVLEVFPPWVILASEFLPTFNFMWSFQLHWLPSVETRLLDFGLT